MPPVIYSFSFNVKYTFHINIRITLWAASVNCCSIINLYWLWLNISRNYSRWINYHRSMYIYIALNSSTNNRRCSSYITYNYSSLSNLYSTFCLYIAINLCVIRKNSLALELPVIEPLTVSFPLHVTLPSTEPNKSIEPNESRSPFIESPSV